MGTFSGHVTFENPPKYGPWITVQIYDSSYGYLDVAWPDRSGRYRSIRVPAGRHLVYFRTYDDTRAYSSEWFDDASTKSKARPVYVRADQNTSGIDALISLVPPPANDNVAAAIELRSFPRTDRQDARNATLEANEPESPGCDREDGGLRATVWYRFTAPRSMTVTVDTQQPHTTYQTLISVFSGDSRPEKSLGCESRNVAPDHSRTFGARFSFHTEAATTYWIQVGGWYESGRLEVSFTEQ